jgi:FAS-associated factor 2
LQQSIEDNEGSIVSSRLERQTRDMNQQIRQQQDQDYLESLQADQEKERKRREEREREENKQQELRRRKQREEDEEEQLKQLRVTMSQKLEPEPKVGDSEAIRLRVNLPNGRKVQRLFNRQRSIKHLFEFVFSQSDCPKRFKLKTNFPVRELPSTHPTVQSPDCRSTDDSNVEPITFAQFGIVKDEIVYLYDLDA